MEPIYAVHLRVKTFATESALPHQVEKSIREWLDEVKVESARILNITHAPTFIAIWYTT